MADKPLRTFIEHLEALRPLFRARTFARFVVIALGWAALGAPGAITDVLVEMGLSSTHHHAAFHRLFSRARWSADEIGLALLQRLRRSNLIGETTTFVLDDTLLPRRGKKTHGVARHVEPVRSTRAYRFFAFGQLWVFLAVVVRVPFSKRDWALPILARLYRPETGEGGHRKRTELAREMIERVAAELADERAFVVADSTYSCDTVIKKLPPNVSFIGSLRLDAALTAAPSVNAPRRPGKRPIRGKRLPTPAELVARGGRWKRVDVDIHGRSVPVRYREQIAQWYRAAGGALLRVVVVPTDRGKVTARAYVCTATDISAPRIVELYAKRWSIETTFRDLKQHLGMRSLVVHSPRAVERLVPFIACLYTVIVSWRAALGASQSDLEASARHRPWYRHKASTSFIDARALLRRLLSTAKSDLLEEMGLDRFTQDPAQAE